MTQPPPQPKLYHITHVDSLAPIIAAGTLLSDRAILAHGGPVQPIGMSAIKRRRVEDLEVGCHPGTKVGDFVPFYFCPRSIMLFVIQRANHQELTYRGGQRPIIHLQADLHAVVRWADANGVAWAFSLSNAGARYTEFRSRLEDLNQLGWPSIRATDFSSPDVKEQKQAEFLLHERFPFHLVERIGVHSGSTRETVIAALLESGHRPIVEVRPDWYF